ncbi:MAG: redoxin domain-containing protein [candidate division NC10 bacterium]|nr:redoxin domain-containing protein [candidate division NC10 bacterium]
MKEIEATGAAVLAVSIDRPEDAQALRRDLGLTFPILSDPDMRMIRAFGMQGEMRNMGDMGYVIIDKAGRIRDRRIERKFGENLAPVLSTLQSLHAGS